MAPWITWLYSPHSDAGCDWNVRLEGRHMLLRDFVSTMSDEVGNGIDPSLRTEDKKEEADRLWRTRSLIFADGIKRT